MTSTGLHQKSVKSGLRPPCFSRRTGGSGHAQCSGQELSSALPRYDAKPARFALNQDSRKLYSGGVTCPGLIRCAGLEQYQFDTSGRERLQLGLIQKKTYMYLKMKSSTMSRINLNLTENYAPSWKTWEGMRELVQNWHDGILEVAQDNGCSISDGHLVFKKYEDSDTIVYHAIPRNRGIDLNEPLSITGSLLYQKSLERVIFINSRTKLHRKILLMGYSKKLKSSNIIGQFGEGLKVGALALVRQGRAVSMVTSSDWWEFELVQDSIYGETVLSVDVRMRNEATSDGIICLNNSRFLNNLPSLSDSTGTFTIVSKISQDEWISFCKKFLFLEVPEERIETELGTLLLGSEHKGQLYVKGVWVSDLLKDGLMTGVNFHNLRMDRDRRAVIHFSDIDHQISCMWVKAVEKHPKLVEKYFDLLNENTSSDIKHSTFYLKDSVCLEAIRSHFCKLYGDKAYPVTADITADKLVQLRKQVQTKIVVLNQNLVNILYLTGKFTSLEVLLQGRPQDLGIKHYVPFHALSGREMSVLMHVQSLVKNVDQTVSLSSFNIVADIEDKPNVRTFICSDNCKRIEIPRTLLVSEKVHLWEGECQEKDKCMCCETLITLQVLDQLSPSLMTDVSGVNKNVFTLLASLSKQVCNLSPPLCKEMHENVSGKWFQEHVLCIKKEEVLQMEIGNLKFRTEESEKQHLADYQKLQEMIKTLEKELNRQEVECVNIEGNLNETWKKRMKTLQDSHQIDLDQLKKDISRQEEEILKFKKEIPYLRAHIKDLESKVLEKSRAYAMHQQTSQERINAYRKLLGQRLQQCYSLVKSEEKEPRLDLDVIGEILEEFRSIEDKDSCLVCVSETRNCTLFPCGHHVLCMSCASALPCCPVCRQVIADRIKTYS